MLRILVYIGLWLAPFLCFSQAKVGAELNDEKQASFTSKYINADKERILGNYDKAYALYTECLELNPKNDGVHYALARLFLTQKNVDAAIYHFNEASELDPTNAWYLTRLADLYNQTNDLKNADKVFKRLRKLDENNPEYVYNHGSLMLYTRNTKKALQYFRDYEAIAGINPELSITKFQYLVGEEEFDLAEKEIEIAIEQFPDEARLYSYLADLYKAQGRYAKALQVFSKAMKIEPNNAYIQLSLAEYFEQNNQADSAKVYLSKAFNHASLDIDTKISILLSKYPSAEQSPNVRSELLGLCKYVIETHTTNPKSHSVYGDFLFLDNQLDSARQSYYRAIDLDPSKFALWNQVLVIDSELNDPSALAIDSKKAIELFPSQPSLYLFKGIANTQEEQYQDAVKSLKLGSQLVIGNKPLEAQLLASLGDAYHELGNHQSSDSAFSAALNIDSNNAYVLNNYSYFLSLRKEKLDLAKGLSIKANELVPNNASYLDTHGWVLYQMGVYPEALEYLKMSLEAGGHHSSEVLEHYGDTLFRLGREAEAKSFWQDAQEAGGESPELIQKIKTGSLNE